MIKIWFLLMLISTPNQPTVKYQGFLFPTEDQCMVAQVRYLNEYEGKSPKYKENVVIDVFCLPFDAFPVKGMNYNNSSFSA